MDIDDEFFNYAPTSSGIVIDVDGRSALSFTKAALLQYISTLQSDTEDTVYVYTGPLTDIPKSLGTSSGHIANYIRTEIIVDVALKCVLDAIQQTDQDSKRTIFYFTDRTSESQARRFRRVVDMAQIYETGVLFVVVNLGGDLPDLEKECIETDSAYMKVEPNKLSGSLLKEMVDG